MAMMSLSLKCTGSFSDFAMKTKTLAVSSCDVAGEGADDFVVCKTTVLFYKEYHKRKRTVEGRNVIFAILIGLIIHTNRKPYTSCAWAVQTYLETVEYKRLLRRRMDIN